MSQKNHYDLIGINRTATEHEVRKGYKRAALTHHPDKGGDVEVFKKVLVAFNVL
jgi:DnaJ-class molecular chaperone